MSESPVALVTGGAHRLGAAFVEALVARGYRVALHYHHAHSAAQALGERLRAHGGLVELFSADLRNAEACEALIPDVVNRLGRLDVLVNSAASFHRASVSGTTAVLWDDVMALNLRAPVLLARAAAAVMQPGSVIVNIADVAAFEAWEDFFAHGTAKAGLVHATRALARALAPAIRVNAIAPGPVLMPVDSPQETISALERSTPLGRLGAPSDVTRALEYLLDANFVTGDVLIVDGGRLVRR